jgi:glucan biosynthesis protein C
VDRQWKLALAVALVFSAVMFAWAWPGNVTDRFPTAFSADYVLLWSAYTLGGWAWPVALLGAVRAARFGETRALAHARGLLNPFYLLHQPVIVVLGFYLVRGRAGPVATFLLLLVGSFSVTTALCTLVKRWHVTGVVFGVRAAGAARGTVRGGRR